MQMEEKTFGQIGLHMFKHFKQRDRKCPTYHVEESGKKGKKRVTKQHPELRKCIN